MISNVVSVIVPVYNVEQYLTVCINSILQQTYKNLEIILVDDGSTDKSKEICDAYKRKDNRIKVIHKENGGLSDARNCGINNATGSIISFIDSDDYISPFFYEILVNEMIEHECYVAMLCSSVPFHDGDDVHLACSNKDYKAEYLMPKDAAERMMYQHCAIGAPFKVCRKEILENIRFPKGYLYEDVATTYKEILIAPNIVFIDGNLYAYRLRNESIMRQSFNEKQMVCLKIRNQLQTDILIERYDLKLAALTRTFTMIFNVFIRTQKKDEFQRNELWKILCEDRKSIISNSSPLIKKKVKLAALMTYLGQSVTLFIGKRRN